MPAVSTSSAERMFFRSGWKSVYRSCLALFFGSVLPSTAIVPSGGPAVNVMVFGPRSSAGSGRCEC